jgi:hypothetical protein
MATLNFMKRFSIFATLAAASVRQVRLRTLLRALFLGVIVAIVAFIWILGLQERTGYGAHTNILPPGTRVVLARDFRGALADQVIKPDGAKGYNWGPCPAGDILVHKNMQAMVKVDPAWDEDSCDPDRPIAIQLASGESVAVPRDILHR